MATQGEEQHIPSPRDSIIVCEIDIKLGVKYYAYNF